MARLGTRFKLLREFVAFARQSRMYWIVPLMLILGLMAFVVAVGQISAPLLYTLF